MSHSHHRKPGHKQPSGKPREGQYTADGGKAHVVQIYSGDCYVSNRPGEVLMTILGSCVSACIRDPVAKIGGMNHFLLPGDFASGSIQHADASARFGVNAMEQLINRIILLGGRKDRMEVKVFGGANVIRHATQIGNKNAEFVRAFLAEEGLRPVTEDLGGDCPRRVHYYPDTGKVMMKRLPSAAEREIIEEERKFEERITRKDASEGDVELF